MLSNWQTNSAAEADGTVASAVADWGSFGWHLDAGAVAL